MPADIFINGEIIGHTRNTPLSLLGTSPWNNEYITYADAVNKDYLLQLLDAFFQHKLHLNKSYLYKDLYKIIKHMVPCLTTSMFLWVMEDIVKTVNRETYAIYLTANREWVRIEKANPRNIRMRFQYFWNQYDHDAVNIRLSRERRLPYTEPPRQINSAPKCRKVSKNKHEISFSPPHSIFSPEDYKKKKGGNNFPCSTKIKSYSLKKR